MSCHVCATKYSWRKKEQECRNCKKSVCKDCLKNKLVIPKFGNGPTAVCTKCFQKSQISKTREDSAKVQHQQAPPQPPDYDDPSTYLGPSMKDTATGTSRLTKEAPTKSIREDPDKKIRERLDKLKEIQKSMKLLY